MSEELVLQAPHVHDWRRQDGTEYGGMLDSAPALTCTCGEQAGDWSGVEFAVRVVGDIVLTVGDVWPGGDHPLPVTAEDVLAAINHPDSFALVDADLERLRATSVGRIGR